MIWPPALIDRYPLPSHVHPAWPWWQPAVKGDGAGDLFGSLFGFGFGTIASQRDPHRWERRDGAAVVALFRSTAGTLTVTKNGPVVGWGCVNEGNVYGQPDGMPWATVEEALRTADAERPLPHPGHRVGQVWARADGAARIVQAFNDEAEPLILAGARLNDTDVRATTLPDKFCFLIADPACPWLAPWMDTTPTESP